MKPISLDLRERIMAALQDESSSFVVAARFRVSASFVRKLRLLSEDTGDIEPRKLPGRERLVQGSDEDSLRELVREQPDATLNVLREELAKRGGPAVSQTTMWRQLCRMGLTLKKTLRATEQDRPDVIEERKRFSVRRLWWRSGRLVFVDESGINLSQT